MIIVIKKKYSYSIRTKLFKPLFQKLYSPFKKENISINVEKIPSIFFSPYLLKKIKCKSIDTVQAKMQIFIEMYRGSNSSNILHIFLK